MYDLKAIFADLQKQQAESGREVVNLSRERDLTTSWRRQVKDLGKEENDTNYRST